MSAPHSNGKGPVGPSFRSNCLVTAVFFTVGGGRLRFMRNSRGRPHWYWLDRDGCAWEFYAPGAAARSYVENLWYSGQLRRAPTLDRPKKIARESDFQQA